MNDEAGSGVGSEGRPSHRDAIDVARILALAIVVGGHLGLAVVDRPRGEIRGENLLALRPSWAWLAAAAPMPVFFAAGGWANATAGLTTAAGRLRTLVGLGAVVVGAWSALVLVVVVATGESGLVGDGARIATQPLWFLAAYVPFVAAGRRLARLAAARPVLAIGGCLSALAAVDVARFGFGATEAIAWPGFFVAWAVPWLLGGWWRDRYERGGSRPDPHDVARRGAFAERRAGVVLAVAAGAVAVVLVHAGGYAPSLIDTSRRARSNTTPPNLYTAVAAMAQVGVLLVLAGALDRAGRRWRRLWDRGGELAVGVYVWHLTALSLCVAVVAAGVAVPERLTGLWWATRPLWWAAVLAVTAGLVGLTALGRARLRRPARPAPAIDPHRVTLGVALASAGGATIGLRGPRTLPLAAACTALFAAAWWLLGTRSPGGRSRG